mmetsp:Transcript_33288/g.80657  ORF Transcript_33288/g.80657 Transcript_33288/m.80657 type:complete len:90 (+) Transcript_33288:143-412(+)
MITVEMKGMPATTNSQGPTSQIVATNPSCSAYPVINVETILNRGPATGTKETTTRHPKTTENPVAHRMEFSSNTNDKSQDQVPRGSYVR